MSLRPRSIRALGTATGPVTERYITAPELAELMGISVKTVRRFTAEGMPSENWGLRRTRRFLASKCIEWAQNRSDTLSSVTTRRLTVAHRKGPTNGRETE